MAVHPDNKYCRNCRKTFPKKEHFVMYAHRNNIPGLTCKLSIKEIEKNRILKKENKTRYCYTCKSKQPLSHFTEKRNKNDNIIYRCNIFLKEKRISPKKGKPGKRFKSLEYSRDSKEYKLDRYYEKRYNISLKDYNNILTQQSNCCGICKEHKNNFKQSLCVDHCHITGKIRGLLCKTCNKALGHFKDNLDTIQKATSYLKNQTDCILNNYKTLNYNLDRNDKMFVKFTKYSSLGMYYRYGISENLYNIILQDQNYKCKICKNSSLKSKLWVDHCHITNNIRGLICGNCNNGIGLLKDNVSNLENSIHYLNKK